MRRLITLLLIGLLVIARSIASAQDTQFIYCGSLSEADCQLLNDAITNLPNLHSAHIELSAQYWQSNQDKPIEFMNISGILSGRLNPETFLSSAGYAAFMNNLSADINIHAPLSLEQSISTGASDHLVEVHLILKDGVLYIDLDSLQTLLNDSKLPTWGCYDLKPGLTARLEAGATSENTTNEQPLTGFDLQTLSQAVGIEVARKYAVVTRSEKNGLVTFETRLDLPGLYADPVYREALRNQIENVKGVAGWHLSKITDQHLDRLAQAAAAWFPEPLLLNRYTVDLEQGFIQSLYSWRTDEWYFSMQAVMEGKDKTTLSYSGMTYNVDVTDFNQTAPIVVPAEAQPFDTAALDQIEILRGLVPMVTGVQSSELSNNCGA